MDDMVEQVLSLCPESDRDEVEKDLNITGDVEWTLNRALDGLLSPKGSLCGTPNKSNPITIVMDNDDDVVMPSPTFTNVKERHVSRIAGSDASTCYNSANKPSLNSTQTTKPVGNSERHNYISLELSDSDSELNDVSETCRKTLEKMKSTIVNLETSSSKEFKQVTSESVPSSPDSDSELLKPVFNNYQCEKFSTKASKRGCASDSASSKNDGYTMHAGVNDVECSKEQKTISVSVDDVCLEEPAKKKKRTKAEIEERKREALLKRAAKEKEKQEKLEEKKRQKEARTAAAQEKKLQKEKDQLKRKAERLTKSVNKLDGCIKFITACLDPALFSENSVSADPDTSLILQKLSSMEANYVITHQAYPGSVSWQRTSIQHSVEEDQLKITTSDCRKEENEALLVLSAEKFVEMVFSFKQGYIGGHENLEELPQTLVDFTKHVKGIYREKKVTFLISGLEKYMRNVKLKKQRAFRTAAVGEPAEENSTRKRRKKKTLPVLDVTWTDIEEALVDLQIKTNVCVYQCETDEDVALKIALFTKAVAERPYKKSLTDEVGFCLDRLDKTSVKVSKDGQGMINVWQQQIQQFRNVSREMAAAIVAEYPSPQLLKQEYEQCPSEKDAKLLLEDILVRRGGGSLATSRRIGPELSKRFYILFHSKENSHLVKG